MNMSKRFLNVCLAAALFGVGASLEFFDPKEGEIPWYTSKQHPDKEYPEIQKVIEEKYGYANYYKSVEKCDPHGNGFTSIGKCPGYFRMCKSFLNKNNDYCLANALESNCTEKTLAVKDYKSKGETGTAIDCSGLDADSPNFGAGLPDTGFFTRQGELDLWESLGYYNEKKCGPVKETKQLWCKHLYWITQWCPGHVTGKNERRITMPCRDVCYQTYMQCPAFRAVGLAMPNEFKTEPQSFLDTLNAKQLIMQQCYLYHPENDHKSGVCYPLEHYFPNKNFETKESPTSSSTMYNLVLSMFAIMLAAQF